MTDVNSGVPAIVSAIQFNKQSIKTGYMGAFPNCPEVRRLDPRRDEFFQEVYGLTEADIDQFFINAAKL